ncbi:MAG: hypothetical protein QG576_464, partial [Bacteroidota bacterium]|nr:hypothetical protein [Bacteroidota bacterium]
MTERIIRCGIAGSGYAAKFHFEALKSLFSVKPEVSGAFSPNAERLGQFTGPREIKAFKNIDELIDNVDVVHICTPPSTHEQIVIAALAKDKHVIVEKPFTGYFGNGSVEFSGDSFSREEGLEHTIASLRRMIDAETKSKGKIMYAENWIYAPAVQKEQIGRA